MYIITQANDRPQQVGLRGFSGPLLPCNRKTGKDAILCALGLNPVGGYVKGSPARQQLDAAFNSVPSSSAGKLRKELEGRKTALAKWFRYRLAGPTRQTMLEILERKKREHEVETQELCERYKRSKEKADEYKRTCTTARRGFKLDYEKCKNLQAEAKIAPMPDIPPDVDCP